VVANQRDEAGSALHTYSLNNRSVPEDSVFHILLLVLKNFLHAETKIFSKEILQELQY